MFIAITMFVMDPKCPFTVECISKLYHTMKYDTMVIPHTMKYHTATTHSNMDLSH